MSKMKLQKKNREAFIKKIKLKKERKKKALWKKKKKGTKVLCLDATGTLP
jgi:hypothetical protein